MPGRLLLCLTLAAAVWLPRTAAAQSVPWNQPGDTRTLDVPASAAHGPGDPIRATTYPQWGPPPYSGYGIWSNDSVDGTFAGLGAPGHHGFPDSYGYPPGPGPYGPGGGGIGYAPQVSPQYQFAPGGGAPPGMPAPRHVYEMLPEDRGLLYDEDIAGLQRFGESIRGAWFRMDYLNMNMRNPGNTLLGAPIANVKNPRQPFVVQNFDAAGNLQVVGTARVMDMTPVDLKHMQGARIAAGIPTTFGEILGSAWGIEAVSRFGAPELSEYYSTLGLVDLQNRILSDFLLGLGTNVPINPNAQLIATSLRDNGEPSNLLILYDRSFDVKYNVQSWGADVNLGFDLRNPNDGWLVQGLMGYKYFQHAEELIQIGAFDNRSSLDVPAPTVPIVQDINLFDPPVVNQIYSATQNRVNSFQFGFRTEYANRWYAVGIEPKIGLGVNNVRAKVRTDNLRDSPIPPVVDDGSVETKLSRSYFSPSADVGFYARINLTDWAAVNVGYNIMWFHQIARADDSIYYNDVGLANAPAVVVQPTQEDLWIRGLSVGGTLTWPKRR